MTGGMSENGLNKGEQGLDPEELPLFREFEAFVAALYQAAATATSRELTHQAQLFTQTITEKHEQHKQIADKTATKLSQSAEGFTGEIRREHKELSGQIDSLVARYAQLLTEKHEQHQ
uniref:hypothetical protein n=1 Tax=Armatimonas sp. TaxID=1872638 RepID=UPI0037525A3E